MATNGNFMRKYIAMTYKEILELFSSEGKKTRTGKEITLVDLNQAIWIMEKKHPLCRWKKEKLKKKYSFVLYEGVIWLRDVYFSSALEESVDIDIEWFEKRIEWYEKQLIKNNVKIQSAGIVFSDMTQKEAAAFFDRSESTIRKYTQDLRRQHINGECFFSKQEIEWLCKNKFKNTYLKLLEKYKMELTEVFISNGGIYDNFYFN